MRYAFGLIIFLWAAVFTTVAFCMDMPPLTGQVVDEAGILTEGQKESIDAVLSQDTQNQIVLATLKSLRGMEIEEYTNQLFNHWKLGDKDKNNGILIVIAPNERQARIEVGYGLEHILTDAIASHIMRMDIIPYAQQGEYGLAAFNGVQSVIDVLTANGNDTLSTKQETTFNRIVKFLFSENGKWVLILLFLVIYVIITGGGATPSYSHRFGKRRSYHFGGGRSRGWFRGGGGRSGGGGASGRW